MEMEELGLLNLYTDGTEQTDLFVSSLLETLKV